MLPVLYVLKSAKPTMAANLDQLMNWLKQTNHLQEWDHGIMSIYYDRAKTELPDDTALLAKIRSVCGALDSRTLKLAKLTDADRLRVQMDYEAFTGPALNGKLIGHRTPEISFKWCSDPTVKKLSDYFPKKVVVLDFWTTWCGPCVAAFPHIRELVAHYEGKPVVFVGITSIQGADYDPDGKIDCKGDPEKEMGLMPGFMKKKSMTWTVAFSTKDAFDPAFGVHDIPHMAIIDRKGVVRYNELRPSISDEEFEKMVDPLMTH
jgi:thiol-disulfide isomerase/thioredoxin